MPAGAQKLTPEPGRRGKDRTAPADCDALWPGRRIGAGFRLEHPLGRRSTVWLATAPSGQRVALKTGPRRLILHEYETVAALAHPNILSVEAFIETEAGSFSVCEYLTGGDLVSLAGLDPRHWLAKLSALIAALSYLHGRGFVHRDLKPRNVMLDEADCARLIDFGSAAPVGSAWVGGGTTIVSPSRGRVPVSPGDDLYALASLVHEMLYGVPAGHPGRGSVTAGANRLADLVDERLAAPVEARYPDLSEFGAVIKSTGKELK